MFPLCVASLQSSEVVWTSKAVSLQRKSDNMSWASFPRSNYEKHACQDGTDTKSVHFGTCQKQEHSARPSFSFVEPHTTIGQKNAERTDLKVCGLATPEATFSNYLVSAGHRLPKHFLYLAINKRIGLHHQICSNPVVWYRRYWSKLWGTGWQQPEGIYPLENLASWVQVQHRYDFGVQPQHTSVQLLLLWLGLYLHLVVYLPNLDLDPDILIWLLLLVTPGSPLWICRAINRLKMPLTVPGPVLPWMGAVVMGSLSGRLTSSSQPAFALCAACFPCSLAQSMGFISGLQQYWHYIWYRSFCILSNRNRNTDACGPSDLILSLN